MEFKREVARSAENTRTGKPIPKRTISQFEVAEVKKDQEVEKVRYLKKSLLERERMPTMSQGEGGCILFPYSFIYTVLHACRFV